MIFNQAFYGVPDGAIYPVNYQPGDACPAELVAAAQALGVLEAGAKETPSAEPKKKVGKAK